MPCNLKKYDSKKDLSGFLKATILKSFRPNFQKLLMVKSL